jgi:hypothetical protein
MKAWKFFVVFFLVIGLSFLALEYSVDYYALNSVDLRMPPQIQRDFNYVFSPLNRILTLKVSTSIISRAIAPGVVSTFSSLKSSSSIYFSLVVDSFDMGIPSCQTLGSFVLSPSGCGVPALFDNGYSIDLQFLTQNPTIITGLNHTGTHPFTLTMRGSFQTFLESQQIVRSVSAACTAPFLVLFTTTQCVVG